MNKTGLKKISYLLNNLGFKKIKDIKEIKHGMNSKICSFKADKRKFILKIYKHKSNFRIIREKLFYNYLNQIKITNVVKPQLFNINKNLSIFPYINGKKIKKISLSDVRKMSNFINGINQINKPSRLPLAIDGIKDRKKHLTLCKSKIDQLKKIKIDSPIKKDFYDFLNEKIIPKYGEIKKKLKTKNFFFTNLKLKKNELIVSPSDFGFHNVIKRDNILYFIDFEYAGLDDPVKLICDFFCQPDQFINSQKKNFFLKNLSLKNNIKRDLKLYVKYFLPFHKLKWCCIILNVFKDKNDLKNNKIYKVKEKIMKIQLSKSKKYFKTNFEHINGN